MNRIEAVKYTMRHKKAFLQIEKQVLGKNTIRGYLHDSEKIFLYLLLGKKKTSKIHRYISRHHMRRARTKRDFVNMVIDWESCRYTKPDKPLTAYETLYKLFPDKEDIILPILKELNLAK